MTPDVAATAAAGRERPASPPSAEVRAAVLGHYLAGRGSDDLAAEYGLDRRTVQRWAAQADILRGRGPRGRTDVPTALIVELREVDRLSFGQIAAEVGMSVSGVKGRYRRHLGIPHYR